MWKRIDSGKRKATEPVVHLHLVSEAAVVVRLEGISKDFRNGFFHRRIRAVRSLSLEVRRGEVFGLLGPNGAGKTTTLSIILGLSKPDSGWGTVLGRPLGETSTRSRIGYLPERPVFGGHLTARGVLTLAAKLFGMPAGEARGRIESVLRLAGLAEIAELRVSSFSKGTLQRLGLAQALINEPELLVLDEPLSGLDPMGRKETKELILKLRDEGKSVVLSSHILPDVETLCDRVAIVRCGELVRCAPVEELCAGKDAKTELVVRGVSSSMLESLEMLAGGVRRAGRDYIVELGEPEKTEAALNAVFRTGGEVVSLGRRRRSLEEVFFEELKPGSPEAEGVRMSQGSRR